MPQDLFRDVFVRARVARTRRSSLVILSIATHALIVIVLIVVPLVATDVLPLPPRAVEFIIVRPALPPVPEPPRVRPSRPHPATSDAVSAAAPPAPTVAPDRIGDESPATASSDARGSGGPPVIGEITGIGSGEIGHVEPPPPPPPVAPIRMHRGIREPRKIVDSVPAYPAPARAARIQGTVIIEATIDVRGNVEAARVLRPLPFLDQAALDAVKQWKYTPALLSGVPVPVIMTVTVTFSLQQQ